MQKEDTLREYLATLGLRTWFWGLVVTKDPPPGLKTACNCSFWEIQFLWIPKGLMCTYLPYTWLKII